MISIIARLAPDPRALYIRRSFMRDLDDARLKRLRFRAWHRGFREADLILGPFADRYGPNLSDEALAEFEALLDQADQDIYEWILERTPAPPAFEGEILRALRAFRDEAAAARGNDHGG